MILLWLPFHAATQNNREIYNGYTHSHSHTRTPKIGQTADAINYTGKYFRFCCVGLSIVFSIWCDHFSKN